MCEKSQGGPIK